MPSHAQHDFLDAAESLKKAVTSLAARGVVINGDEPWDSSATEYIRHLASHLVRADECFAPREFELLAALYADGTTVHEEYELAKHVAIQSPGFFDRSPGFLAAASDGAPEIAAAIRTAIRRLIASLIAADGFSDRRERALAESYLRLEELVLPTGTLGQPDVR